MRQSIDGAEDNAVHTIESKLDDREKNALVVAGIAVRGARDKKVSFKLPNGGLCSSITNEVAVDKYTILFKWDF